MKILGIESSCDETAAAVVQNGTKILSNVVFSQEGLHRPFKGIVPEIASRAHLEKINRIVSSALTKKSVSLPKNPDIDAIAVTVGPGLVGSLIIGKMTAQALSWAWNKPLIGINHLEAHLYSNLLDSPNIPTPFLGLIISGGHTDLILVKEFGSYEILGRTRDDAVGECFDKVATILELGYPGGPVIDRLGRKGNPNKIQFPKPYLSDSWDFSFSGLKTAMLYFVKNNAKPRRKNRPLSFGKISIQDICASFQDSISKVLSAKCFKAAHQYKIPNIVVGGGVSANSAIRGELSNMCRRNHFKLLLPSRSLCTDNAAMVAAIGHHKLKWARTKKSKSIQKFLSHSLSINPSLPIEDWK